MGVSSTEFDSFEQQLLEIIGEFQSISTSETRYRDALRAECNRAETAEMARSAADRAAGEARASAAAATAGASKAAATLSRTQDELAAVKMQVEVAERQRVLVEERCFELSARVASTERELQQLRPLQASHSNLQRQFLELQERIRTATDLARNEASRLETELRRVERCASGGAEVRERARLAAAAHARERRLTSAELQHTSRELLAANAEIARLNVAVATLQRRLSACESDGCAVKPKTGAEAEAEGLAEARAALEAERAGAAQLESALASALNDAAELASRLHSEDAAATPTKPGDTKQTLPAKISALDSFLAD